MLICINGYAGGEELLKERNGELVDETNSAAQTKPALPRQAFLTENVFVSVLLFLKLY